MANDVYQEGFRDGAAFFMGWIIGRLAHGTREELATAEKIFHNWRVFRSDFLEGGASVVRERQGG